VNDLPKRVNNRTDPAGDSKLPAADVELSKSELQTPGTIAMRSQRLVLVQGWIGVALWMTFGLLLEGLLGYKAPAYLLDNDRRELFRLAHTHGTILSLLLVAAAICAARIYRQEMRAALMAMRAGSGFLLAGVWHYESDPGLGIWLVPPGALLMIFGVVAFAIAGIDDLRTK
jgi:hypothetical protein